MYFCKGLDDIWRYLGDIFGGHFDVLFEGFKG